MAQQSAAQFYERFLGRVTLGLLLLAIALVIDCAGYFVDAATDEVLRYVRRTLSVVIIIVVAPSTLKLMWNRWKSDSPHREPESFVVEIYKKASLHGFTFVALALVVLQGVLGAGESTLPALFFIKAVLAAMLLVTSLSFYLQMQVDDDLEEDDFDDEASS